jgi:hypothetical protein
MSSFRPRRPSPALVVSIISLVVAMGGAGYAAVKLPKGSVGNKQLKSRAVTTKKIKDGAVTTKKLKRGAVTDAKIASQTITGGKIKLGTLGTVPSANQANSANSANTAASATIAGSAQPAAFAHVSATGGLDTGNSKNVGAAELNSTTTSLYCISGIPFTPKGGQATVDGTTGGAQDAAQVSLGTFTGCPAGTQALVYTWSASGGGTATPDPFFVMFYQ